MSSNIYYIYANVDNYLHEEVQAVTPPSATFSYPNDDSIRLRSLGVHEYWNNPTDKQYSRNLGFNNGIELVQLQGTVTSVREQENTPAQLHCCRIIRIHSIPPQRFAITCQSMVL